MSAGSEKLTRFLEERVPPGLGTRLLRYGIAGGLATILYFLVTISVVEFLALDAVLGTVVATAVVTVVSYALNRQWVFESSRGHASAFPRFVFMTVISFGLNAGIMHLTVNVIGWWYVTGLFLTTAIVPATNFFVNYLWIFKDPD